jgi:hypothetical protein
METGPSPLLRDEASDQRFYGAPPAYRHIRVQIFNGVANNRIKRKLSASRGVILDRILSHFWEFKKCKRILLPLTFTPS